MAQRLIQNYKLISRVQKQIMNDSKRPSCFHSDSEEEIQKIEVKTLKFQETTQPISSKQRSSSLVYEKNQVLCFTNEIALYQQIKNANQTEEDSEDSEDSKEQSNEIKSQCQQKKSRDQYRYYNIIVCKRCSKIGHSSRNCSESCFDKCKNCMRNHRTDDCSDYLCLNCGDSSHEGKCENMDIKCIDCQMVGHTSENCGVLIRRVPVQQDLNNLMCLWCKKRGHFNCNMNLKQDNLFKTQKSVFQKYKDLQRQFTQATKSNYYKTLYKK